MKYKGYTITKEYADHWHFQHDDFDGAPDSGDNRIGHGNTLCDAKSQIEDRISESVAASFRVLENRLRLFDFWMVENSIKPAERQAMFRDEMAVLMDGLGIEERHVLKVLENHGWTIPQLFKHEISLQIAKK